jgi:ABC-type bacteriocin/lantibiotic exporter with double-glycine peptidase domain
MSATPFLSIVVQRHKSDCSVACLAMLLGLSYEEVLVAFRHNVIAKGATTRQILGAASRLGRPLRWTRKVDLEADTGLLALDSKKWPQQHLVVLKDELIVDSDATVWDADVYLAAYEAVPLSIIKAEAA